MKTLRWVGAALVGGTLIAGCSAPAVDTQTAAPGVSASVTHPPVTLVQAGMPAATPVRLAASAVRPKAAAKPAPAVNPMQGMGGLGRGLSFSALDPKRPSQTLWKALTRTGGGNFGSGDFSGQDITAWLYNAGKLDAKMTAPQGKGSTITKTVVASGGATYTSLVPGQRGTFGATYMTAQTVTWNATTKHGIAQGNVHYHNGKSGLTADGPVLYFNSGLRVASSQPLGKGQ